MKKLFSFILITITVLTLTGCGVKGDLYMPEKESEQTNQAK